MLLAAAMVATPAAFAGGSTTYQYSFDFVNGETISGSSSDKVTTLAGAGGISVDNPTGMEVHLSCSDPFTGGWGKKDGPRQGTDTAWQIASFSIIKLKGNKIDKTCGDDFKPPPPPPPATPPAIDIENYVNGHDADLPPGPEFQVGDNVTFTFDVTNTGPVSLSSVHADDSVLGPLTCPKTTLAPGESMACTPHTDVIADAGQYTMTSRVTGTASLANPAPPAANNGKSYSFTFMNGVTISGVSDGNVVFLPNAGGTSADNPTGMDIHVSCSDGFAGGWGEKDGPRQGTDSAWQIASFTINKYKGDKIDKTCGDTFAPVEQTVTDSDPLHYTAANTPPPPAECTSGLVNDKAVLTWDTVPGATTYAVWRNNQWVTRTRNTTFTDANAPAGQTLSYEIVSVFADGSKGARIPCGSVTPPPTDPPPPAECISGLVNDKAVLTWDTVPGATTYAVWRNNQWVTRTRNTTFTDANAPAGQTLSYEILPVFADGSKGTRIPCGSVTPPPPDPSA